MHRSQSFRSGRRAEQTSDGVDVGENRALLAAKPRRDPPLPSGDGTPRNSAVLPADRRATGVGAQVGLWLRRRRGGHRRRGTCRRLEGLARDGSTRSLDCAAALPPTAARGRCHRRKPRRLSCRRPGGGPLYAPGTARNRSCFSFSPSIRCAMTEGLPPRPFSRRMYADSDDLVAARWWQESLHRSAPDRISRRNALLALALTLGPAAGGGLLAWLLSESDEVDITMDALELQRREGWSVGHVGAALQFPDRIALDVDGSTGWRDALSNLALDLAPAQMSLAPFYVPTLFQAPAAPGSASLRAALTPVAPAPENRDMLRGEAIRSLFEDPQTPQDVGVIVDVPGPSSVAVAAGMAPRFDPVFVFDNWPHPLGVVPSHLALGAALYYRPLFMRLRATRTGGVPPVFVLDRNRLARYTEEETQFDNRYVARLPTARNLQSLGIRRLLYVTPDNSDMRELDDLNADFVAFRDASIEVKVMPLSDLMPPAQQTAQSHGYYYGGHAHTHF